MAIPMIVIAYACLMPLLPVGPAPTDDLFYIDAAYRIVDGSYQTPTKAFPFHHYLRWPVTLPLAALFATIGPGSAALALYSFGHLLAIAILSALIVNAVARDWVIATIAALVPLVMPADMLPVLVRCEPAALLWALASIALALHARGRPRLFAILSGMCMAVSVNATNIALFSAPIPLLLMLYPIREARIARSLLFIFGAWVVYEGIMLTEWLVLGDHMIQYKCMKWWHFRLTGQSVTWAMRLDPDNREVFVFGLLMNLMRQQPVFVILLIFGALGLTVTEGRTRRLASSVIPAAIVSLVLLEVVGGFAIQKFYIRFLTIPIYLILLSIAVSVAGLFRSPRAGIRNTASRRPISVAFVFVAFTGATAIFAHRNATTKFAEPPWTHYYRDPIDIIQKDMRTRDLRAGIVEIITDRDGEHSLIPWSWAIRCYSDFKLVDASMRVEKAPTTDTSKVVSYFVRSDLNSELQGDEGWIALEYEESYDGKRPVVFVAESINEPTTRRTDSH